MTYAQIKNGVVVNTIVTDNNTPLELFSAGFDFFIQIDNLTPIPGPGWSYDGANFAPPIETVDDDDC